MTSSRVFGGVDLSQSGLGLVAVPAPFNCDWGRVEAMTCGGQVSEEKGRKPTPEELADHLVTLVDYAVKWLTDRGVTDVAFEQYPMGKGGLFGLDRVCEVGGALRHQLRKHRLNLAPTASAIASARKLFLGSLSHAHLAQCVRDMKASEVRKLGKQKAAVWAESQRIGCGFEFPDEADAFVAANWAMHEAGLPAVAGVGGMAA